MRAEAQASEHGEHPSPQDGLSILTNRIPRPQVPFVHPLDSYSQAIPNLSMGSANRACVG